jgi:hypothetical protein
MVRPSFNLLLCICGLQETVFKVKGDMTKVNLYYDQDEGCVRGVKATYGAHDGCPMFLQDCFPAATLFCNQATSVMMFTTAAAAAT